MVSVTTRWTVLLWIASIAVMSACDKSNPGLPTAPTRAATFLSFVSQPGDWASRAVLCPELGPVAAVPANNAARDTIGHKADEHPSIRRTAKAAAANRPRRMDAHQTHARAPGELHDNTSVGAAWPMSTSDLANMQAYLQSITLQF